MEKQAEEIAKRLRSIGGDYSDEEFKSTPLIEAVEELVFRCECCDWWCDRDTESDKPLICEDCMK